MGGYNVNCFVGEVVEVYGSCGELAMASVTVV